MTNKQADNIGTKLTRGEPVEVPYFARRLIDHMIYWEISARKYLDDTYNFWKEYDMQEFYRDKNEVRLAKRMGLLTYKGKVSRLGYKLYQNRWRTQ